MKIRAVFRDQDDRRRSGWRIAVMFVLLAGVIALINIGRRALDLPGRQEGGPWPFLVFASLVFGGALGVMLLLLRLFEQQGPDAIGLPFSHAAWKPAIIGTALGTMPIVLLVVASLVGGYGSLSPGDVTLTGLAAVVLLTFTSRRYGLRSAPPAMP